MRYKVALGDVCSFYRGASIPRARMYDAGDYLYIHYGDLYKGFDLRIDVEDPAKPIPYILGDEKIKANQRLQDQDIVYVLTSETADDLGHAYLFNNPKGKPAVSGTETTIVRVERRDFVVPAYLSYLMSSPRFIGELRQYTRGMKVFRVHPNDVARIEVDLPSVETQHRVVAVLDAIYAKQQANARLNGYLEELCQTLFDRCDLDQDGVLVPLSEVASVNPRRTLKKGEAALCVEMADLSTSGSFPLDWRAKPYNGGMKFMNGDTIMARITPCLENGKAGYINFLAEGQTAFGSTEYIVIAAKNLLPSEYFYFLARNPRFISYAVAHMNGSSGRQRVSGHDIERYEVRVPSKTQLTEFKRIATSVMETILANSLENRRLAALRDALLPKLMSGEIDVSKVDLTQLNSHLV